MRNEYSYAVTLLRDDGSTIVQSPLTVDWDPAREWTRLQAIRRGRVTSVCVDVSASVEPVWDVKAGAPYIEGFRVLLSLRQAEPVTCEFPNAYFRALIQQEIARLAERGTLRPEEQCRYLLAAFPREASLEDPQAPFSAEEVDPALPLRNGLLSQFVATGAVRGQPCAEDVPVFIPQVVVQEAAQLARQAGAKETGGILIGHLHHDPCVPELFAEVTAQIHARDAEADASRLSFTAETWTSVRAALALRRHGEVMLGWWHSHPVREWCKDCPPERQQACRLANDFFSAHDRALHRAVFPRAYSVALVVNDLPSGEQTFSLFGWRLGLVEPRGFHETGADLAPSMPGQGERAGGEHAA